MASGGMVWINGRDVSGFGFTVRQVDGMRTAALASPTDASLGRSGDTVLGADRQERGRNLTVAGIIDGATAAAVTANVRALVGWCHGRLVEIVTVADPLVRYYARLSGSTLPAQAGGQFLLNWCEVTLTFTAQSPRAFHRTELPYRLTTTRTMVTLGTAISAPLIRAWSYTAPLSIITRDSAGRIVNTFVVAYTLLSANDGIVVDCHERTVRKSIAGALTLAQDQIKGEFPVLDPRQGAPELGLYPSVELSSGVGELLVRPVFILP